jgi:hypothetical protein
VRRHTGLVVFTRARLYALLPTIPRLHGPAIDRRWDDEEGGPCTVTISESGVLLSLDVRRVDPRLHGELSLQYRTGIPDDALAQLPKRALSFPVAPAYVFHLLGVRER